jgi:hypothetical protein
LLSILIMRNRKLAACATRGTPCRILPEGRR